jgi:hypothetical protein
MVTKWVPSLSRLGWRKAADGRLLTRTANCLVYAGALHAVCVQPPGEFNVRGLP